LEPGEGVTELSPHGFYFEEPCPIPDDTVEVLYNNNTSTILSRGLNPLRVTLSPDNFKKKVRIDNNSPEKSSIYHQSKRRAFLQQKIFQHAIWKRKRGIKRLIY